MKNVPNKQYKIIAEFMGAKVTLDYPYNEIYGQVFSYDFLNCKYPENKRYHTDIGVKYDKSFDWLVPVVEKILSIDPNFDLHIWLEWKTDVKVLFQLVLEFITKYYDLRPSYFEFDEVNN